MCESITNTTGTFYVIANSNTDMKQVDKDKTLAEATDKFLHFFYQGCQLATK